MQSQAVNYDYMPLQKDLEDLDARVHDNMSGILPRQYVIQLMAKHNVPMGKDALPTGSDINYRNLLAVLDNGVVSVRQPVATESAMEPRPPVFGTATVGQEMFSSQNFAGHGTHRTDITRPSLKHLMDRRNHGEQGGVATVCPVRCMLLPCCPNFSVVNTMQ